MTSAQGSLRSIISGAAALSAVSILRLVMQFVSLPIMARLLEPQEYGLAAIAMPIAVFVMVIADAGISNSLVRLPSINTSAWHTCFCLLCMGGTVLALGLTALSPLASELFGEPQLAPILMTLSSIVLLQSVALVPSTAMQHQKHFLRLAGVDATSIVVSIVAAIALATAGFGVWSLVWQQVIYFGLKAVLTWVLTPYRPARVFALAEAGEHIAFGWNLLCANVASFLSRSADNLVIGRVIGSAQLGIYAMAFQFGRLPLMLVTGPIQGAMYPHLTQWKDSPDRLASAFLVTTRMLALLIFPPVALVAAACQPVFTLLLSERWVACGPVFAVLAAATALQAVRGIGVTFLMVLGRTDVQKKLSLQFSVLWIAGILLTVRHGILAVAACYTLCVVVFSFWSLRAILPLVGCSFAAYSGTLYMPLAVSLVAVTAYEAVAGATPLGDLELSAIAAALALSAVAASFFAQRGELIGLLRRLSSRPLVDAAGAAAPAGQ